MESVVAVDPQQRPGQGVNNYNQIVPTAITEVLYSLAHEDWKIVSPKETTDGQGESRGYAKDQKTDRRERGKAPKC